MDIQRKRTIETPSRMHKWMEITDIEKFTQTATGRHFKKKKIKINDCAFKLHLFPNGIDGVHTGFVQYVIELIKLPLNVESITVYIHLYCIETATQFKQTKIFKEINDSEGWWMWSLSTKKCEKYNMLQFGYDIDILQIHYNSSSSIQDYSDQFILKNTIEYNWKWKDIKYILSKIKRSKHDTMFFTENVGDDGMWCFSIESNGNSLDTKKINICLNLLKLPLDIDKITVLFKLKMGAPEYSNTFKLSYNATNCKLKLIQQDVEWLLLANHDELNWKCSVQIIEKNMRINNKKKKKKIRSKSTRKRRSKHKLFMKSWYRLNDALNKYYNEMQCKLDKQFLNFVEQNKFNDVLIEWVVTNNCNYNTINDIEWNWEYLHFDEQFPIPKHLKFSNMSQRDEFISFVMEYCYHNKNPPSMHEMEEKVDEIKLNDMEFVEMKQKELCLEEENMKLLKTEKKSKQNQDEIDIEKQELIKEEFKIKRMMQELEKKKKNLEKRQNDIHVKNKEIERKRKKLGSKRKVFEMEQEEKIKNDLLNKKNKKQNVCRVHGELRKQKEMRLNIQRELNDVISIRKQHKWMDIWSGQKTSNNIIDELNKFAVDDVDEIVNECKSKPLMAPRNESQHLPILDALEVTEDDIEDVLFPIINDLEEVNGDGDDLKDCNENKDDDDDEDVVENNNDCNHDVDEENEQSAETADSSDNDNIDDNLDKVSNDMMESNGNSFDIDEVNKERESVNEDDNEYIDDIDADLSEHDKNVIIKSNADSHDMHQVNKHIDDVNEDDNDCNDDDIDDLNEISDDAIKSIYALTKQMDDDSVDDIYDFHELHSDEQQPQSMQLDDIDKTPDHTKESNTDSSDDTDKLMEEDENIDNNLPELNKEIADLKDLNEADIDDDLDTICNDTDKLKEKASNNTESKYIDNHWTVIGETTKLEIQETTKPDHVQAPQNGEDTAIDIDNSLDWINRQIAANLNELNKQINDSDIIDEKTKIQSIPIKENENKHDAITSNQQYQEIKVIHEKEEKKSIATPSQYGEIDKSVVELSTKQNDKPRSKMDCTRFLQRKNINIERSKEEIEWEQETNIFYERAEIEWNRTWKMEQFAILLKYFEKYLMEYNERHPTLQENEKKFENKDDIINIESLDIKLEEYEAELIRQGIENEIEFLKEADNVHKLYITWMDEVSRLKMLQRKRKRSIETRSSELIRTALESALKECDDTDTMVLMWEKKVKNMEENKVELLITRFRHDQNEQISKMNKDWRGIFQQMLDSVNEEEKLFDSLHKEMQEKEKKEESRFEAEKYQTNLNPFIKTRKIHLEHTKIELIDHLERVRGYKKQNKLNKIIQDMNNKSIYEEIKELGSTDILEMKQMDRFCKTGVGKTFIRKKLEIGRFGLKIYIYPNGINDRDKGFVQYKVRFNQIPSDIKFFIVYCKLFCIESNTEYRCCKKCDNNQDFIGWWWSLLSLKHCKQFDKLRFEYDIKILQICYNRDRITDHVKLNWPQFDMVDLWQIEKKLFTTMKYCRYISMFYNENHIHDGFCVSMGCMGSEFGRNQKHKHQQKNNKQINVSFHIFKLPPKVQKMSALCELTIGTNPKIKKQKECTFDYNSTQCVISLDKKYSDRLLATSEQNHCGKIGLLASIKIQKVYFRDFMDTPQEIQRNSTNHDKRAEIKKQIKENNKSKAKTKTKSKSLSSEKSIKNAKYIKRGNGKNHKYNKQRKRNNKKQKNKSMKLTKKGESEENHNDIIIDDKPTFKCDGLDCLVMGNEDLIEELLENQKERVDKQLKTLDNLTNND